LLRVNSLGDIVEDDSPRREKSDEVTGEGDECGDDETVDVEAVDLEKK
jgi:hypothetical protein